MSEPVQSPSQPAPPTSGVQPSIKIVPTVDRPMGIPMNKRVQPLPLPSEEDAQQ